MVRATVDFNDADYERLRRAAQDRGVSVESFVVTESLKAVPQQPAEVKPFETWQEFFDWCDQQKFSLSGWKWNREELYDRKVLR